MIETTRLLDDTAQQALHALLGKTFTAYEAYIMFEGPDQVFKTLRLEFGDKRYLLSNEHMSIPLGPDASLEEVSVLSMLPDDGRELWYPSNKQIMRKVGVDLRIDDIYLVVDTIELTKGDIPVNKLKLTQAVVFREGARLLAIDRDIWFDEYLTIREGMDLDILIRDAKGDWSEEPPFGYKFTRDVISLALGVRV